MDINDLKQKFDQLARQAPQLMDRDAPHVVATVAANHFKDNFQTESFEGAKWPEVNRRKDYFVRNGETKKNYTKGAARLRPILTGETGDLGRSIEPDTQKTNNAQAVVTMREYGKYHDEGSATLPRRQITGQTPQLNQLIASELDNLFNRFFNQ